MLNIDDLQKRHRVYKLKIFLPYIVIFVGFLVILLLVLFVEKPNFSNSPEVNLEQIKTVMDKNKTLEIVPKKVIETKKAEVLIPAKKEPKPIIVQEIIVEKNSSIKIHRQSTKNDIEHVLKRFKKNNNPALSLFIAKKYYEMQDYHQSYNYALITNTINDNIDASWIIFAKSLFKLDKKDDAIKTLKAYIEHSKSAQAKTLLEEMQRGKFI